MKINRSILKDNTARIDTRQVLIWILLIVGPIWGLLGPGCQPGSELIRDRSRPEIKDIPLGMTEAQAATLSSLQQVDDYPLYTMVYQADYSHPEVSFAPAQQHFDRNEWACSLFAALGDPEELLLGRNFDWDFSPGLLLFTDPPDGYASVSMVDLYYLGFGDQRSQGLTDLPLEELIELLEAPYLPFDGMNEAGLAVGMAAVPEREVAPRSGRDTVDSLRVIRYILDHASTVEEAVGIIGSYNIDWEGGPALHYLIADRSGHSALVEFSGGEIVVLKNQQNWQAATNFLVSEAEADPSGGCWRYKVITRRLEKSEGKVQPGAAMELLEDAAQENTQWSVVYRITADETLIVMGGKYQSVHQFRLFPEH